MLIYKNLQNGFFKKINFKFDSDEGSLVVLNIFKYV